MSQMTMAVTVLILLLSAILLAVYALMKKPKEPLRLLIVGYPETGKTRLFHHLVHDERPNTVKSAKISDFSGYILPNSRRQVHIYDVPSDARCGEPEGDIALVCLNSQDKQAAELVAKWHEKCRVGCFILQRDSADFRRLICDEVARAQGLEHVEFPEKIRFAECNLTDDWQVANIEKVLAQL